MRLTDDANDHHVVTNMSEEEFAERLKMFEEKSKQQKLEMTREPKCPVCGAHRQHRQLIDRFTSDILNAIRNMSLTPLDSCILCVQKHVSRAMTYYEELLTAQDSGKEDGTAAVNIKMNHLKILGHLGCAIEESVDYKTLNELLVKYERAYRYDAISPDWQKLAEEIVKVENELK